MELIPLNEFTAPAAAGTPGGHDYVCFGCGDCRTTLAPRDPWAGVDLTPRWKPQLVQDGDLLAGFVL